MAVVHAVGVPELDGLVVVLEDRHVEAVGGQAEVVLTGDELPGPRDGVGLGVATEGEVAEHLEEGEVAGVADVVDVVGAQALLAGRGADLGHGLDALVVLLELVHAGVGEQQRRVVGHQRRGRIELAALLLEELQEVITDLGRGHGLVISAHISPCIAFAWVRSIHNLPIVAGWAHVTAIMGALPVVITA